MYGVQGRRWAVTSDLKLNNLPSQAFDGQLLPGVSGSAVLAFLVQDRLKSLNLKHRAS